MATKPKSAQSVRQYWLFKSEPEAYSISDLAREPTKTTCWDGVRNYQARNFLRDTIQRGDRVLFYHSNAEPMVIVGTTEVVRTGYPVEFRNSEDMPHNVNLLAPPPNPTKSTGSFSCGRVRRPGGSASSS